MLKLLSMKAYEALSSCASAIMSLLPCLFLRFGILPFPLLAQNAHPERVPIAPVAAHVLPGAPFQHKAGLLVRAHGARVVLEDTERDAVQVELGEAVAQDEAA